MTDRDQSQGDNSARGRLVGELNAIRLRLESIAGGAPMEADAPSLPTEAPPGPLDDLCRQFQLSAFERAILVLCAGVEVDPDVAALCGRLNGDPASRHATFDLALRALPGSFWAATLPSAPLRSRSLVEVSEAPSLIHAPLRINEAVLHFLLDRPVPDER